MNIQHSQEPAPAAPAGAVGLARIEQCFAACAQQRKKALIPFITAGFPGAGHTVPLMHTLVEAGTDLIELGVPFSDPMADGPTIQRASEAALAQGIRLLDVLAMVREFRTRNKETPVVLMGYANPLESLGVSRFARLARESGVDGVLTVDYPPEESADYARILKAEGLAPVFLLAPTSSDERIAAVSHVAAGYVYYVSLKGVTGASNLNLDEVAQRLPKIKALTGLPVGVGFGIRDAQMAAALGRLADAVIVGSRLIEEIEQAEVEKLSLEVLQGRVFALMQSLRHGLDASISR